MVARFGNGEEWQYGAKLSGMRRDLEGAQIWYAFSGVKWTHCQVYDAPDPGEGWRLIDVENEQGEVGDEFLTESGVWLPECRTNGFEDGVPYRRRITPTVTYVPFAWEDREQLRGRWVRCVDVPENEWAISSMYIGGSGELRANGVPADRLAIGFIFLDTNEPVGRKVTQ